MEVSTIFKAPWLASGLQAYTPIQETTYEPLKTGQSIIGLAPTGSGKTLAYALPILEQLMPNEGLQAVILAPSQELVMQLRDVLQPYAKVVNLKIQTITGKANMSRQIDKLKQKPELIIATTGRLLELVGQKKIKLHQLQHLIVDEADELITDQGLDDVRQIAQLAAEDLQIAFFSATQSPELMALDKYFLNDFKVIDVRAIDQTSGQVEHLFVTVNNQQKVAVLKHLAHQENFQALVFFNQASQLKQVEQTLTHQQVKFATLSSQEHQTNRQNAMQQFKQNKIQLLLVTDVLGRGIDLQELPYVINFDQPRQLTTYIHRAGRTGRMGHNGTVITLGNAHDFRDFKKLLNDQYQLEKRYLKGDHLVAQRPESKDVKPKIKETSKESKINKQVAPKPMSHDKAVTKLKKSKKRHKNQKNKGYHPKSH